MMKKHLIIVAGILSVIALISVQAFIISQIWQQKDELFRMRYRQLSQEALDDLERENRSNGFDTALYFVDYYSSLVLISDEFNSTSGEELKEIKKLVKEEVEGILNDNQYL